MKLSLDFKTDERGVSPVIGVILMVAITVILAAVIGAFVLNLGSNLGNQGPTASLSVQDASGTYSGSTGDPLVTVSHNGGDKLTASNTKIVISWTNGGTPESDSFTMSSGSGSNFKLSGSAPSSFSVGDSLTIVGGSSPKSKSNFDNNQVTVKIVDTKSQSVVGQSTVTVN